MYIFSHSPQKKKRKWNLSLPYHFNQRLISFLKNFYKIWKKARKVMYQKWRFNVNYVFIILFNLLASSHLQREKRKCSPLSLTMTMHYTFTLFNLWLHQSRIGSVFFLTYCLWCNHPGCRCRGLWVPDDMSKVFEFPLIYGRDQCFSPCLLQDWLVCFAFHPADALGPAVSGCLQKQQFVNRGGFQCPVSAIPEFIIQS